MSAEGNAVFKVWLNTSVRYQADKSMPLKAKPRWEVAAIRLLFAEGKIGGTPCMRSQPGMSDHDRLGTLITISPE